MLRLQGGHIPSKTEAVPSWYENYELFKLTTHFHGGWTLNRGVRLGLGASYHCGVLYQPDVSSLSSNAFRIGWGIH